MSEHAQLVRDLKKCPHDIYGSISVTDLDLIHMIMGISGEAGELLDAVKKATIYRKPIDISNIVEELGDLEFYLEGLRQILGLSRQDILDKNITKLRIRYGQKYSDKAAHDRVDKLSCDNLPEVSLSDISMATDDMLTERSVEELQAEGCTIGKLPN